MADAEAAVKSAGAEVSQDEFSALLREDARSPARRSYCLSDEAEAIYSKMMGDGIVHIASGAQDMDRLQVEGFSRLRPNGVRALGFWSFQRTRPVALSAFWKSHVPKCGRRAETRGAGKPALRP
uniref:Uncharacterized protein n=1 Tax=Knipowitschia caucasica TaxID=637954 RepID=A0AAV2LEQ5_KNICA